MALVSVLIPFRNAEPYLKDCLQSILNQSFSDYEVILINDHSEDQSLSIALDFQNKDSRFKVLSAKQEGIIAALRQAYNVSCGDYITRMDADDIMMPDRLDEQFSLLKKNGLGFVSTGKVHYFSDEKLGAGYQRYQNWLNELQKKEDPFEDVFKECVLPSPCWMMHRKDFEKVGGFESDVYPEDYDLCFRIYRAGIRILASDKVLHKWRDYPVRTSRTDPRLKDQSFLKVKLRYFLELKATSSDQIIVWGAGDKGKKVIKILKDRGLRPAWVCNNKNKIGKEVDGTVISDCRNLQFQADQKVLVLVAQRETKDEILVFLEKGGWVKNETYFWMA